MTNNDFFAPLPNPEVLNSKNRRYKRNNDENWTPIVPVPSDVPPPPKTHSNFGPAAATYEYRDCHGNLCYLRLRFESGSKKEILPLTYGVLKGRIGWHWKAPRPPLTLYGLDGLSAQENAEVLVVEGEKCADVGRQLFPQLVVVTSPEGAGAASKADWSPLLGRPVRIWPDADEKGQAYAEEVAQRAHEAGATEVRMFDTDRFAQSWGKPIAKGWDVADAVQEGMTPQQGTDLLADDDMWRPVSPLASEVVAEDKREREPNQREKLVSVGLDAELWRDPDGEAYATVEAEGHKENHRLRSKGFKRWLLHQYGRRFPCTLPDGQTSPGSAGSQAVVDALNALEAKATTGPEFKPGVRIVAQTDCVFLDLGNSSWEAVRIDAIGWQVVQESAVKFIRPSGLRPLPTPTTGGNLERLRRFVNLHDDKDFVLVESWLVGCFSPRGPYPILVVNGEQGSAKTTTCRLLRRLVDPNQAEVRSSPRTEQDLMIAGKNGHIVCLDNLSAISPDLADAMCRVATGSGFAARTLYTDMDETIISICRPQVVNGIPDLATRSDLADRAIVLSLPPLTDEQRRPEAELWDEFGAEAPQLLGALLDAVSSALRNRATVRLETTVRMADFAVWVVAASPALGFAPNEFLGAYRENREGTLLTTMEGDIVADTVLDFLAEVGTWEGTATELLELLERRVSDATTRKRDWPKTPSQLSGRLLRAAPVLRQLGFETRLDRNSKRRRIHIDRTVKVPSLPSSPSQEGVNPLKQRDLSKRMSVNP